MSSELRPYQIEKIDELYDLMNNGENRIAFQSPTGSGKTIIATNVIQTAMKTGRKAIFTVPRIDLIGQTIDKIKNEGMYDVGVIQGKHKLTNPNARIQVCSAQTLMRRSLQDFPKSDVVIVDECHIKFDLYDRWMNAEGWEDIPFIGLSATPWTKGLGALFSKLVICTTTQNLINEGYLSKFRVFGPNEDIDLSGVRTVAGDYHEGDLSKAMNKKVLIGDVVKNWKEKAEERPTLVFGVDRAHAKNLENEFLDHGIPTDYIDGETPLDRREEIRDLFQSGKIQVVCSIGCLTMGVDWDVRCVVLARPTKSKMLFVQIIGRGLRIANGKEDCLILDHSDTHQRLGFVTDIHHETLDDGKPKPKEVDKKPKPRACKKCRFMIPAGIPVCPNCGDRKDPTWMEIRGDLVELPQAAPSTQQSDRRFAQLAMLNPKIRFLAELKFVAEEKGYKIGWVSRCYFERFGTWPSRGLPEKIDPVEPSIETKNWIREKNSKYIAELNKEKDQNKTGFSLPGDNDERPF